MRSLSLSPLSVIAPKREASGHWDRKRALFSGVGGRIRNSLSAACMVNNRYLFLHLARRLPCAFELLRCHRWSGQQETAAERTQRRGEKKDWNGLKLENGSNEVVQGPRLPSWENFEVIMVIHRGWKGTVPYNMHKCGSDEPTLMWLHLGMGLFLSETFIRSYGDIFRQFHALSL